MKTKLLNIGATLITALFLATTASSSAAVATVDLTGAVIASGSTVNLDSGSTTVSATTSYTYSVSGTVNGTGAFAIISNTSLASFVDTIEPGSSARLTGTYVNAGGTLPVAAVYSETFSGTFLSGAATGSITLSGAIDSNGKVSVSISNVTLTPNLGTLVFSSGEGTVDDGGIVEEFQPDGIIASGSTSIVGADVYSPTAQKLSQSVKLKKTKTTVYTIQNDGTTDDSFTIKGKKGKLGFKVKYFEGLTDVTALVVSGSYQTGTLAVGGFQLLTVNVTNKSAAPGTILNVAIEATSDSDSDVSDKITISAKAK